MSSKVRTTALCLAILALGAAGVSVALGDTVQAGNLIVEIEGQVSPQKLPKKTPAPITLNVSGSVKTADGTHPPVLKTIALEFDKHGSIYTKGLPTCNPSKLQATLTAQAKKVCGPALVGSGKVSAQILFPEQPPFNAAGPLLIFNGKPKGGKPVLVFHVHANVPAPTTFVTTGVISKASGKYGTSTEIAIPTIVGGQGSLTSFNATLHKTWTYKGQKKSLLLASCPTGALFAHGEFTFSDGTKISGDVAKNCTPTN
ncbi:MAG: hypothetical protein H0X42_04230 [Solirubrobacterales bacterium]|nr:hypothetical protein [Solirubrobacterales bacterium]